MVKTSQLFAPPASPAARCRLCGTLTHVLTRQLRAARLTAQPRMSPWMWPGDQLPVEEKLLGQLRELCGTHVPAECHLLEAPLRVSPGPPSFLGVPSLWDVAAGPAGARRARACSWAPQKPDRGGAGPIWSQAEPRGYTAAQGQRRLGLGYRTRLLSRVEKPEPAAQHRASGSGLRAPGQRPPRGLCWKSKRQACGSARGG